MKKILILAALPLLILIGCKDVTVVDASNDYQVTMQVENVLSTGYAPRIVYTAEIINTNRVIENQVLVDYTKYLHRNKGTLPTKFDEPFTATIRRNKPPDATFEVLSTFYDVR